MALPLLNRRIKITRMREKLLPLLCLALTCLARHSSASAMLFSVAPTGNFTSLPLSTSASGPIQIENQYGGPNGNYTFVFSFAAPLTKVSHAVVTGGIGSVASGMIDSSDPTKYIVNLSGVTDAQYLSITLSGISGGGGGSTVSGSVGILIGDTTGNGVVNSSDIAQVQSQSGLPVTSLNFREDVTGNGVINSSDIALVQSMSGTGLGPIPTNLVGLSEGRPVPDNGSSAILFALSALTIFVAKTRQLARNSGG